MKHFFLLVVALASLAACTNTENKQPAGDTTLAYFGDTITVDGAVPVAQLMAQLSGKDSVKIKLEGTIKEVCQNKGCWMTMSLDSTHEMRVKFKDYAFFVPKDASGKKVVIDGWAVRDSISVADLRHYAEDAGKDKAEIEKITAPEAEINFMAGGVIIRK
jgi:Domain of unknown function (DUF4920)